MGKYRLVKKFTYGEFDSSWYEIHKRLPIIGWVVRDVFEGDDARELAQLEWRSILYNGKIVKSYVEDEV